MNERELKIKQYLELESDFTDFLFFQGEASLRISAKAAFINGDVYVPDYAYPKLSNFAYDTDAANLKSSLLEASFGLYEAPDSPEKAMKLDYIHSELAHMALVQAAASLHGDKHSFETNRSSFLRANFESYGEYDFARGRGMLRTEKETAEQYIPKTPQSVKVKREILNLLNKDMSDFETEPQLMEDQDLQALHSEVWKRWEKELNIVPDTDNTVSYKAYECANLLRLSLKSDGLAEKGWTIDISPESIVPMTSPAKKCIIIPANIAYTASDIRRIMIGHEQKIHAWRAENGDMSGNQVLKIGTPSSVDVEEGLGIITECAIEGNLNNPSLHRARDRYITAGLALGADGQERDAREVYEILWRTIAIRSSLNGDMSDADIVESKNMAYTHVENAFRGTPFWQKGVIYTKLKVYFEGLVSNVEYMNSFDGNVGLALDTAMVGKYDHTSKVERDYFN